MTAAEPAERPMRCVFCEVPVCEPDATRPNYFWIKEGVTFSYKNGLVDGLVRCAHCGRDQATGEVLPPPETIVGYKTA